MAKRQLRGDTMIVCAHRNTGEVFKMWGPFPRNVARAKRRAQQEKPGMRDVTMKLIPNPNSGTWEE